MIIDITDPSDPSIRGALFTEQFVDPGTIALGGTVQLIIDKDTSSADPKDLFNLEPPPEFFGNYMVWGQFDAAGALNLFLSPTDGEATYPFATLNSFADGAGSGTLIRSNQLPPTIRWQVSA